jgi:glycosyltransferase involved in cell wall biosynthesis
LKNDDRFQFIFLGEGFKRSWLEKEIESKSLKNVTLLDPRPRTDQNIFLNACDVAFVSLVKKMRGVSMPSRTYNILAVGKPILALVESDSETAKVVLEDQVGWIVPPNEPQKLLQTIEQIYKERNIIPQMSNNARRSALEKYSLQKAVSEYRKSLTASDNVKVLSR